MVLLAGLEGRLLIPFSLWLCSIVINGRNVKFWYLLSLDLGFSLVNWMTNKLKNPFPIFFFVRQKGKFLKEIKRT